MGSAKMPYYIALEAIAKKLDSKLAPCKECGEAPHFRHEARDYEFNRDYILACKCQRIPVYKSNVESTLIGTLKLAEPFLDAASKWNKENENEKKNE